MKIKNRITVFAIASLAISCANKIEENRLFQLVGTEYSGINFNNLITENDSINILNYEYLYNGGGVGVGDFNNDDLPDIFFSGGQVQSRVYINKDDLKFKDITKSSGINTNGKWCTGVSIIDINQDGYDDIYLSIGGMGNKSVFPNLLYINNGDLTFTESASEYGLADKGESIQSLFFDYDLDGDLDMYLLTGGGFEKSAISIRKILENGEGRNTDRLYRNDFDTEKGHPVYTNVSGEAGITIEGFGLGVSVLDANNDHWPDLYISNDYLSRDFLYVNQKDGTFKESAMDFFGHTSHFSMGNDIADINNDGLLDVITVDMLPEDVKRRKLMSGAHHSHDVYQIALRQGYGHQQMRNMLQLNTGEENFNEVGQLAGIDKTDWSWAPLIADFDNDGFNDIYITNGYGKDITDMDFVKYREKSSSAFGTVKDLKKSVLDCLYNRPNIKVPNYAYKNNGNSTFTNVSKQWGFEKSSISNGSAYADLDADGDLDLIVNNINENAFIYKNTLREKDSLNSNYLKVKLDGSSKNLNGLGAKVSVYSKGQEKVRYNNPVRGFQSSVESILHFGLKDVNRIDSLIVNWPDGRVNRLEEVAVNQLFNVAYSDSSEGVEKGLKKENKLFVEDSTLNFHHKESVYNDFAIQSLLLQKYSNQGPILKVGDLNNDGLEDVFIGGSYGENSVIFYQTNKQEFKTFEIPDTNHYEDTDAFIFDANGDGFNDLYVTSGGSERYAGHKAYQDRIYFGDNNGGLKEGKLPEMLSSTSTIAGGDYDNDGDLDLFVGGRIVPGRYPEAPKSYILQNNSGNFKIVTDEVCPFLNSAGMITSAVWTDFNKDSYLDLVITGEFMPITLLKGNGSKLQNITENAGLEFTSGLWNSIAAADFDNDGDIDFVAGNLGLNSHLKVIDNQPITLDYADFDNNGSIDPIVSKYEQGHYYPIASLDQLIGQLPVIKKKFQYYNTFANSSTEDILSLFNTKDFKTLKGKLLTSSYIENLGNGQFKISMLPLSTQIAPIKAILKEDIDNDGNLDLLMVGNDYGTEVGAGKYDASVGHVLINDGKGNFKTMDSRVSGFYVPGDSRSIVKLPIGEDSILLIGRNNDSILSFKYKEKNNSKEGSIQ